MATPSPHSSAFWALTGSRSATRKVRADAKLQNLSPEAQDLVAEWCLKPCDVDPESGKPIPGTGGFPFARARLAEVAERCSAPWLRCSERALGQFLTDWGLAQDMAEAKAVEAQVFAQTKDVRQAIDAGVNLLAVRGVARQDPKLITLASRIHVQTESLDLDKRSAETKARQKDAQIAQKEKDLALSERRVKLLEENAAKAKQQLEAVKQKGGLTPEVLREIEEAAKLL